LPSGHHKVAEGFSFHGKVVLPVISTGIFGATGYTGHELVRILSAHPQASIRWATSESYAGQRLRDVFPCPYELQLLPMEEVALDEVDVVFACLPHGASMEAVAHARHAGVKVVDLSADFRLADPANYESWYNVPHTAPDLLPEAVYGLPELHRAAIRQASLVANPGCYPTSVILGLHPLVSAGLLADSTVIVDAKSGVSGAGRKLNLTTHFVEANENFSPYNIGHTHRHIAEMEQELAAAGNRAEPVRVIFSPHLLPVNRGILSTMYVQLLEAWPAERLVAHYREVYAGEPFVQVLEAGRLATLRHVVGSNRCAISLTPVGDTGRVIVVSCIDNLIKGASGQAVQNMNLMFGLEETMGLGNSQ